MRPIERSQNALRLRSAVRRGMSLLPDNGDVDQFVVALAGSRSRELRLLEVELTGNSPSGAWVPTDRRDYFLVPRAASPTRRRAVLCHEAAHILLGHDPALHASLDRSLLLSLAPNLPAATSARLLQRSGYRDEQEAAAERVGTLLAASLEDRSRAITWARSSLLSARLR